MRWIDLPPIWLLAALYAAFWLGQTLPFETVLDHMMVRGIGVGLVMVGLILMGLAVTEMRMKKTTVLPYLQASHLVRTGIFARTRNPIYLGDVFVLVGCILWWGAWVALPLVAALVYILTLRFIQPEETRLREKFGAEFIQYETTTRRWL
jgi:protein-S-isoprenylcysteine O-methyltransferase Ste14